MVEANRGGPPLDEVSPRGAEVDDRVRQALRLSVGGATFGDVAAAAGFECAEDVEAALSAFLDDVVPGDRRLWSERELRSVRRVRSLAQVAAVDRAATSALVRRALRVLDRADALIRRLDDASEGSEATVAGVGHESPQPVWDKAYRDAFLDAVEQAGLTTDADLERFLRSDDPGEPDWGDYRSTPPVPAEKRRLLPGDLRRAELWIRLGPLRAREALLWSRLTARRGDVMILEGILDVRTARAELLGL